MHSRNDFAASTPRISRAHTIFTESKIADRSTKTDAPKETHLNVIVHQQCIDYELSPPVSVR